MKHRTFGYRILANGMIEITKYGGNDTKVIIPDKIDGRSVTSIGYGAFNYCTSLTSITIPDSVTSIGSSAFYNCTNLTSITIPEGVTSIGWHAFYNCTNLTSITIPEGVTSIGVSAFYNCTSLTSIAIPEGVTSIGYGAFEGCASLTSITIPEGVTIIGGSEFEGCTSLTSITIPEGVTIIGGHAFYNCANLKSPKNNYKAFNPNLICEGGDYSHQYHLKEWSKKETDIELCKKGYHFVTNLFDIFNYYNGEYGVDFVVGLCDVGDKVETDNDSKNSKCVTNRIKPVKILTREEFLAVLNGKEYKP